MPRRHDASRHLMPVAALALALALGAGGAHGATVSLIAPDGSPVPVPAGAPPSSTGLSTTVQVESEASYSATVFGPDGAALQSTGCSGPFAQRLTPTYVGNGTYAVDVVEYADGACTAVTSAVRVGFRVDAGVDLPRPASGAFLIRNPDARSLRELLLPVGVRLGGATTEIRYRLDARLDASGGIRGTTRLARLDTDRPVARLTFPVPGVYTVVARATNGSVSSPWSPPLRIRTVAPFTLDRVVFPDTTGPSYLLRGTVRDRAAAGARVRIAIAPGARGGTFRPVGAAPITRAGTFTRRFVVRSPGVYRLRYSFAGNARVLRGERVQRITITRTLR